MHLLEQSPHAHVAILMQCFSFVLSRHAGNKKRPRARKVVGVESGAQHCCNLCMTAGELFRETR